MPKKTEPITPLPLEPSPADLFWRDYIRVLHDRVNREMRAFLVPKKDDRSMPEDPSTKK